MAEILPKLSGYETTYITQTELSDKTLKELQTRLSQVVSSFGGEVILTEDWGKRKLAYPIQKENRGHYTYMVYTGKSDVVHEIERNLKLQDPILRYLTVQLATEFDPEIFQKNLSAARAAAKRREEEKEARREERNHHRREEEFDDYDLSPLAETDEE